MPFDPPTRHRSKGLSLIEVIVSLAIFSAGMIAVFNSASGTFARQAKATAKHQQTVMARAILDEYTLTYPFMEPSGTYKNTWRWEVEEQPHVPEEPIVPQDQLQLIELSIKVWPTTNAQERVVVLETVVARSLSQ